MAGDAPPPSSRKHRTRPRNHRVTVRECTRFFAVRCGGWCNGSFLVVAVCPCQWLVAGLCVLVMNEEVVIHLVVVGGLLCFLCIHLDAVL